MSLFQESNTRKKSKLPAIFSAFIVVGLIVSYFFVPDVKDFFNEGWTVLSSGNEKEIEKWVSGFGWMGPLVIVLAMVFQMFLIIIPSVVLIVVSVLAYGAIGGSLIALLAIYCASTVGYIIGKKLGESFLDKLLGHGAEQKIEDFLKDYGFWAVVITRINPFLSNDAISFVAGSLGMNYWKFIGATLLGISPLVTYIAIIGESTDSLKTGLLWGSIVSALAFIGYIYWDKKIRKSN